MPLSKHPFHYSTFIIRYSTMSSTVSAPLAPHAYPQQRRNQGSGPSVSLYPLRSQVEFYFSPQNLAKDTFLKSQLNAAAHIGAVPMETICNFPKVRQINALLHNMGHLPLHMLPMADPRLVRMALQHSTVVTVSQDGAWISPTQSSWNQSTQEKPNPVNFPEESKTVSSTPSSPSSQATTSSSLGIPTHPLPPAADSLASRSERTIIILRDIPDTVSPQEVLQAFATDEVAPKAARPDVGNTWFVNFETEDQAVKALASANNKMIGNFPVRGCLKSDIKPTSTSDSAGTQATSSAPPSSGNTAPLHTMPITYPVVFPYMPMQQSHAAYGYVYSIPHQQGPIHVRAQPPQYYPFGYANQGYLPSVGGYPATPNVYTHGRAPPRATDNVNLKPVNGKQQTNKKWHNKKKPNGFPDQVPFAVNSERIPFEASQRTNVDKKGQKNKQQQLQRQQEKRKSKETKIDLGAEHFPALGNSVKRTQTENKLGGYAQALLKKPLPRSEQIHTDAVMSNLAVTSDEW